MTLNDDQFQAIRSEVAPAGEGVHLITVGKYEGDKRVAARSYTVRKSNDLNPSARGGAYTSGWRVRGTKDNTLHPTRKAAVAAAEHHFTNVYLGGR
jgi:hypothetical protein